MLIAGSGRGGGASRRPPVHPVLQPLADEAVRKRLRAVTVGAPLDESTRFEASRTGSPSGSYERLLAQRTEVAVGMAAAALRRRMPSRGARRGRRAAACAD